MKTDSKDATLHAFTTGRVDVEPSSAGETMAMSRLWYEDGPVRTTVPAAACPMVGANCRCFLTTDATGWLIEVRARMS